MKYKGIIRTFMWVLAVLVWLCLTMLIFEDCKSPITKDKHPARFDPKDK